MLRHNLKTTKKIAIHLTFKQQKHPWDIVAEQAKQRHQTKSAKKAPNKKAFINLKELILPVSDSFFVLPPTEPALESCKENAALEEYETSDGGFYPCPSCTCWFTHQKDLDYHIRKWCDR